MKLFIKPHNRELLQKVSEKMSDSSLTAALNFVLDTQGATALEQLEAMRSPSGSSVGSQRAIATPQSPIPEHQVYIPELDGNAVESAFD